MRTIPLLLTAAAAGTLVLLLGDDGAGQGKHKPEQHKPVVVHPGPIHTPAINPAPVHKTVVVKPQTPHVVKLPNTPKTIVEKPVVIQQNKTVIQHGTPGKVIIGSSNPPTIVHHETAGTKVIGLPHGTAHYVAPHTKVVNPVIQQKVTTALVKRPAGKDWNVISVNRYKPTAVAVRNKFRPIEHTWFTRDWWDRHHYVGAPAWSYYHSFHHHPYYYWWRHATWPIFTGWVNYNWGQPFYYDYGDNLVYQNNLVYLNGVPVASPVEYAEQAYALADAPPPAPGVEPDWLPLGAFALSSSPDDPDPERVWQLAISKDGLISGTAFNKLKDTAIPLEGRVDPATQRVAIKAVDRDDCVLETGIYNLTQPQTPVLMHFGVENTQTWFLVRLSAPPEE